MTIPLFILAVIFYTLSQLVMHSKIRWTGRYFSNSGRNKYGEGYPLDNWYYRFFKIPHRERFPGSATIFVTFTDFYHLSQAVFKVCLCLAIAFHKPFFNWWIDAIIFWSIFSVTFAIFYNLLQHPNPPAK